MFNDIETKSKQWDYLFGHVYVHDIVVLCLPVYALPFSPTSTRPSRHLLSKRALTRKELPLEPSSLSSPFSSRLHLSYLVLALLYFTDANNCLLGNSFSVSENTSARLYVERNVRRGSAPLGGMGGRSLPITASEEGH